MATGNSFRQINLVADVAGRARLHDVNVVNPWGIAMGPTPLWVANEGSATATVYTWPGDGSTPVKQLMVKVPPGTTGQVFNPTDTFLERKGGTTGVARFLFDTEGGQIVAWSNTTTPLDRSTVTAQVANHVYLGLALGQTPNGPRLFAADIIGRIDVFDPKYRLIARPGAFVDPTLPAGLGPYNVAYLDGMIYVAYAVNGPGATVAGAISVFTTTGTFVKRLVTGGRLRAPWGMVIAPDGWGRFGGALLVGNVENGQIHAYNRHTGAALGVLRDGAGKPLANSGLWGLHFGNGIFGRADDLVFAAGVNDYRHGLVGVIRPNFPVG
ncbi:MAG TPA: TIGR03118 family protein [Dermatophilaceae bacterium]|nr:TIGR03118 family protein [Dermatophilaceae bacterium]